MSDTPPASQSTNRTTVLDNPAQAPTAGDPFDLDFFNQGPKNEPGAGHGQKEGQPNPQGGSFSFDDFSLAPTSDTPPAQSATGQEAPAPAASTGPSFNFDFDMPSGDLPSASTASTTPASPEQPAAPDPFNFGASEALTDDVLPSVDPTPTPAVAPPPPPMASAFDFSDFDLPAAAPVQSAGTTPIESVAPIGPASSLPAEPAPPTPVQSGGFSFGDIPDITPDPAPAPSTPTPVTGEATTTDFGFGDTGTESGLSLEKPDEVHAGPLGDTTPLDAIAPVPTPVPSDSALDIGDVFGTAVPPTPVNTAESVSFDKLDLNKTPQDDGLNLSGVADQDDFGFGAGGDDFGFGTGLSAGPDASGAAVYEALANSIEELSGEISRSLSFYLERVPDAALSRIYLTGGGALLKNLDVFLTGRLGAPTAVLNPLQLLPVAAQSEIPNGPLYTVALGLALRDFVD